MHDYRRFIFRGNLVIDPKSKLLFGDKLASRGEEHNSAYYDRDQKFYKRNTPIFHCLIDSKIL